MDAASLKRILQDAGVCGAGGAGFPTYAKISGNTRTIILNSAECEPLLNVSRMLLNRFTAEVVQGLRIIAESINADEIIVASKEDVAVPSGIRAVKLRDYYPVGDEIALIHEATGIAVFSVETALNVHNAANGLPVTHKWVTVTGAVKKPVTARFPIGAAVSDVLETAGGATEQDIAVIMGGVMMGTRATVNDVVTKTGNGIIVLPVGHYLTRSFSRNLSIDLKRAASACCQCRTCTDMCPRSQLGYPIQPHRFMRAAVNNDFRDTCAVTNAAYCSGCGVCEHIACPQSLAPRALITEAKRLLAKEGFKAQRTEAVPNPERHYRMVNKMRLTTRLGLKEYDKKAEYAETNTVFNAVRVPIKQHIGAAGTPVVSVGETVAEGQPLTQAAQNALSLPVHASIPGVITEISGEYISIRGRL